MTCWEGKTSFHEKKVFPFPHITDLYRKRRSIVFQHFVPRLDTARLFGSKAIEPEDVPECGNAVFPADFLALIVTARAIGDRHLPDPQCTVTRQLGGHFRLNTETLAGELQILHHLPAERLVTGLHVRQMNIGKPIGAEREQFIAHFMFEIANLSRRTHKA